MNKILGHRSCPSQPSFKHSSMCLCTLYATNQRQYEDVLSQTGIEVRYIQCEIHVQRENAPHVCIGWYTDVRAQVVCMPSEHWRWFLHSMVCVHVNYPLFKCMYDETRKKKNNLWIFHKTWNESMKNAMSVAAIQHEQRANPCRKHNFIIYQSKIVSHRENNFCSYRKMKSTHSTLFRFRSIPSARRSIESIYEYEMRSTYAHQIELLSLELLVLVTVLAFGSSCNTYMQVTIFATRPHICIAEIYTYICLCMIIKFAYLLWAPSD